MKFQIKNSITDQSYNIHERTIAFLNDSGFRIVKNTQQNISFDDEKDTPWRMRSNMRYYKLTDGKFDFAEDKNNKTLSLVYSVDIAFEVTFFLISLFCGIAIDHIYLIAPLVILLSLLAKLYFFKSSGKSMMKSILG